MRTDAVAWLEPMTELLREPLAANSLARVAGPSLMQDFAWVSALPEDMQFVEGDATVLQGCSGWVILLQERELQSDYLFVSSRQRTAFDDRRLLLAVALARIAWRLHSLSPQVNSAFCAETTDAIHAVRNGLNTLRMTSAVFVAHTASMPDTLKPFVTTIDAAAARTVQSFNRLCVLIESEH